MVVPGAGPLIQTSSFLLASLSPWLRHLLQSAGEDVCLCLPSVSSHEVPSYLPRVYSGFQNHIFIEFFSGFQSHIFLEFIPAFKSTFSVEFLPLCCAGPSRQDRRRAEVERGDVREGGVDVVALAHSSPRK